ncbi:3-dehydroquinate synthase [Virgibacillus sp. 179-BFC.A HS]|uniref:3-dehydroquinate synthase n=1 Tax=Tigheibacillus jepli TaxID=3035914 RepID=A0ABU5CIM9_9BACI|nr:3-dehydroquinate synthase [Virgibacillus sp. 179-BFC.A HS]MDY0405702.1 3-dehydroquinate synthase [Virgibacillus sp. 179-BFC.A HS]
MDTLHVKSSQNVYPVYIGRDLYPKLNELIPDTYTSILIIADQTVADLYLGKVINGLKRSNVHQVIIPSGEASKNIKMFYELQTKAIEAGLDRNSLILALGGGMVGDLAGFVAATFMRGIDFIQLPTTILAHDSSVGGKVAINHEAGKNLIGSFHAPAIVIYDIATLQSLPKKEIRSGFAELVKEAMIDNTAFYKSILQTDLDDLNDQQLIAYIKKGIKVKAAIVEADEKELGIRKYLNYGHTLGHALEAELGYGQITHGEAVAFGTLFATNISEKIYDCDLKFGQLFKWFKTNAYPLDWQHINLHRLIERMKMDKKSVARHIQMVLLKEIGSPTTKKIRESELLDFLEQFMKELG